MRPLLACITALSFGISGCAISQSSPRQAWQTGFWLWKGDRAIPQWKGDPLDAVFLQVGSMGTRERSRPWASAYPGIPANLPRAREYWLVFRYEQQGIPNPDIAPYVADAVTGLRLSAVRQQLKVAGIQLDIDCPTARLHDYARLIHSLREYLPGEYQISITALLDWFRDGTAVGEVVREADEFVPQFYDGGGRYGKESVIASKVDGARWGPVFNRFGKRFRVGISTFGRVHNDARYYFGDLSLLDVGSNPAFQVRAVHNETDELVLRYDAARRTKVGYVDYEPGTGFEFVLATPESVRVAVDAVRHMGGQCAGVLFFRWPSAYESLTMFPEEVLEAAGLRNQAAPQRQLLEVDGHCATVSCRDLYLESAQPLAPAVLHGRVRVSTELEYMLPNPKLRSRMSGPSQIEFSIPAYCGRGRLFIGRAVTLQTAEYTLEDFR
jgi:hypothetical protein